MAEMDAALDRYREIETGEAFTLQGPRLLKVELAEGSVMARSGSMVAYQGDVHFEHKGGGLGRLLKKAATGEQLRLMQASGTGELFLANQAMLVHLLRLDDDSLTVNGANILAFEPAIQWDIRRVEGAGMMSGGLFNTLLQGSGWVAITTHGAPVILETGQQPTFADAQSAVAWSANLQTRVHAQVKLGAFFGRSSGESIQMGFAGQGFVIVQASEGPTVPAHSHGNGGKGGFNLDFG